MLTCMLTHSDFFSGKAPLSKSQLSRVEQKVKIAPALITVKELPEIVEKRRMPGRKPPPPPPPSQDKVTSCFHTMLLNGSNNRTYPVSIIHYFFQIDRLEHINYNSFFQQAKSAKKLFLDGGDDNDDAAGGVASSHIIGGPNVIMEVCRI